MIVIMYLLIAKGEATIALVNRHTDLINFICMTNCLVEHSASICFVLLEHGLKRWERIMRGESAPLSLVPMLKMTDKISTNKVWCAFVDKLMLLKQWPAFYKKSSCFNYSVSFSLIKKPYLCTGSFLQRINMSLEW